MLEQPRLFRRLAQILARPRADLLDDEARGERAEFAA
jgi:hypothetical protein